MKKNIYLRSWIVVILMLCSVIGWATTRNVPGTYSTIQLAVNAAASGDIISVAAGTYAENVNVNKSVIIDGAGSATTHVTTSTSTPVFTISANNVQIKNLEVTSSTVQLAEGIRISGASSGLILDYVHITKIGNNIPTMVFAYGLKIMNSFSNLSIDHSLFSASYVGTVSEGMGIYAPEEITLSSIQIQNTTFSYLFMGLYLQSGIDGFTATSNTFGPQELQDCILGVACIYFGDQKAASGEIKNITITGNTFSNFARGVYFYDAATDGVIGSVNISNNIFNTSIFSSPIRMITRGTALPSAAEATLLGPVTIDNNTFNQTAAIAGGDGVAMIDLRAGKQNLSSQLNITNNQVTFSGGPYALPTYGVLLRGPVTNANITGNTFGGGGVGGSSLEMPETSGIVIFTDDPNFGPISSSCIININGNNISSFSNAISLYNHNGSVYGGVPPESTINIHYNIFAATNTVGLYSGPGGDGVLMAEHNYWGGTLVSDVLPNIKGNINPQPWCNETLTICDFGFNPLTPIYNGVTGEAYSDPAAAIENATSGEPVLFTEPIEIHGFPPTTETLDFVNLSDGDITVFGASPALSMSTGDLTFDRFNFITPTNTPTIQVTGGALKLRNCVIVASSGYNNNAIEVSGTGTVDAGKDGDPGYNRFLYTTGDLAIKNTGSGIVDAYSNFWGKGTETVPVGPGAAVLNTGSGSLNIGTNFPVYDKTKVDIALYNYACSKFSVRLRPFGKDIVNSTTNFITNLVFTIRWPAASGITTLPGVNILFPTLALQSVTLADGYYYAVYAFVGSVQVGWLANTEHEIMNFTLPGTGTGTADFFIINDSWTLANNADYYFEMTNTGVPLTTASGYIYKIAPGAPLNCNVYAKALLTGPLTGSIMSTNLNVAPNLIPAAQPFNTSPWYYAGTETTSALANVTDWVLVELRSNTTTVYDRKAALLNKNGNIYDVDGVSPLVFRTFDYQTNYYLVINHRNHSPVMSALPITLPNTIPTRYDFTVAANLYGSAPAVNTAGLCSMVPGDINHDGKLKYSGAGNDRALIIAKIATLLSPSPVYLNSFSAAGYWLEDLNLNKQILYSGPGNDASAVIYPAIENLIPGATLISVWTCPVSTGAKNIEPCPHNGSIDATLSVNGNNLEVNLSTNELLTGAYVDNIQFAVSWDASLKNVEQLLGKSVSNFNLKPQGEAVQFGDKMYQMFAMVDWKALPDVFKPGTEVTVLSIPEASSLSGKLFLNSNDIIKDTDLGYYVSVFGNDKTGQVKNIVQNGGLSSVVIYPNPANNNNFTLTLNSGVEDQINLQVYDMIGRVVLQEQLNTISGKNNFKIATTGLTPGAYLIKLSGTTLNYSAKLVVQ